MGLVIDVWRARKKGNEGGKERTTPDEKQRMGRGVRRKRGERERERARERGRGGALRDGERESMKG